MKSDATNPLSWQDILHFGKINRVVGEAFACSPEQFWEESYVKSPSGLTVNKARLMYPTLINREGKGDGRGYIPFEL